MPKSSFYTTVVWFDVKTVSIVVSFSFSLNYASLSCLLTKNKLITKSVHCIRRSAVLDHILSHSRGLRTPVSGQHSRRLSVELREEAVVYWTGLVAFQSSRTALLAPRFVVTQFRQTSYDGCHTLRHRQKLRVKVRVPCNQSVCIKRLAYVTPYLSDINLSS